jgi:hypothetical protein
MTKHPANEYNSPEEDAELGFNKWFYRDFYGPYSFRIEYFMDDIKIEDENQRKQILIKWLNSAFLSGYECALYAKLEQEHQNFGGTT